ncbi:hypothetical protein H0H92_009532 [Tricholoma furcatifolium]|nr:hypothetical protein H0H92_009532 [Tricholoma furcatifolium]
MPIPRVPSARVANFMNGEITFHTLEFLNLGDICQCSQVSKEMRRVAHSYISAKLRRILKARGVDIDFIMPLLRRRKSIIAGSITLMLINPWTFHSHDIDFYVPRSEATAFVDDLKSEYAVNVVFNTRDHSYIQVPGAYAVYTLRNGDVRFNVVVSWHENPLLPLTFFHSSVVFNYISATEVYVGYPQLTFAFRNIINASVFRLAATDRTVDNQTMCLAKYFYRGYDYAAELFGWPEFSDHICRQHIECPKTTRAFQDGGGRRFLLHNLTSETIETAAVLFEHPELAWDLFD